MDDLKKTVLRIEYKLDKVIDDQSQIKTVQASQAADLKYHIARTDASEARIELVEEKLLPLIEIKHRFDGIFMLFGKVISGIAFVFGAVKAAEAVITWLK